MLKFQDFEVILLMGRWVWKIVFWQECQRDYDAIAISKIVEQQGCRFTFRVGSTLVFKNAVRRSTVKKHTTRGKLHVASTMWHESWCKCMWQVTRTMWHSVCKIWQVACGKFHVASCMWQVACGKLHAASCMWQVPWVQL